MVFARFKKTSKLKLILPVIILVVIGTVVAVFVGYRQVSSTPELLLSTIKTGADLSIGKIRQTSTRNGKKQWTLEARSADYMENEKKVILKQLAVTFFLKNQDKVYLVADRAVLNTDTNDIEFSGNVVVRNKDYRLKTENLIYENERRIITCNVPLRIIGNDARLAANSASYDLDAGKIVMNGNIDATISAKSTFF